MEKNQAHKSFFLNNRIVDKVVAYLYPLIIALYSMCRINKGLDITDTAYNYSNFNFLSGLDDMWYFSTFLSNLLGRLFTLLPGGQTMLGLNFYTGLVKMAILLLAFFFLTGRVKLSKHLTFIGVMMASGLNWCPTAVLYNYLTYLLLMLGLIFIYEGLMSDRLKRENIFLALAGLTLGLNLFVRLPNLCEAALILAVWYISIIRKESFVTALRRTLVCVGGYFTAFLLCVLLAIEQRGLQAYIRGISQMFEGGNDANSQYTLMGLIFTAFSGYIGIKYWAAIAFGALGLTGLYAWIICRFFEGKIKNPKALKLLEWSKYLVAVAGFLGAEYKFLTTYLYTTKFYEYSSMYGINVIALLIAITCMAVTVFNKNAPEEERFLSMALLILIGVTPLGSNNGMYSVLNNLYLVLPLMLKLLFKKNEAHKWLKPAKTLALLFVAVALVHSLLFGLNFCFRDGGGEALSASVENNKILKGMKTIPSNAQYLTEVTQVWNDGYEGSTILVFGNAAGLSFYLNAKPAISTVWPSLTSFSLEKFENEMTALRQDHDENKRELPVVIMGRDGMDAYKAYLAGDTGEIEAYFTESYIKKLEILYDFLNNYNYSEIYYCDTFWVLASNEK